MIILEISLRDARKAIEIVRDVWRTDEVEIIATNQLEVKDRELLDGVLESLEGLEVDIIEDTTLDGLCPECGKESDGYCSTDCFEAFML